MTTEVAILNKSAVALAADSAVTISRRGTGARQEISKIYVDANKLFELIKGAPVGVMIYNSAEVAGIPWETLIKVYRGQSRLSRFSTLEEYARDFLCFVERRIPQELDDDDLELMLLSMLEPVFHSVYEGARPHLIAVRNRVDRRKIFRDVLDQFSDQLAKAPVQDWAAGLSEDELWKRWSSTIIAAIPVATDELILTAALRRKVARLVMGAILRVAREDLPNPWSGIVIAGFGEEEMFPSVYHAAVGGLFEGRLILVNSSVDRINGERPAIIQPYAQTGEAMMFLHGIDPTASNAVTSFWRSWSGEVHQDVCAIVDAECAAVAPAQREEVRNRVKAYMEKSWVNFADYMTTEFHERRLRPIEASAGFLSKGEIAGLAENLVEFTSLRNRVSLDRQETVGGATDVAVISKGDGFIWVKRKHYFDGDRNPGWATQQVLGDVASRLDRLMTPVGQED